MKTTTYLIVGGGMTAAAAVDGIRSLDPDHSITIISAEPHPPYDRPPLSKGLWKGKPIDKIWRNLAFANTELILDRRVVSIDPGRKTARDDHGQVYAYHKLLLATGGTPRKLPFGGDEIIYYRNLDDYKRLNDLVRPGKRFGVIGGGFIGSEIAAALKQKDQNVVMVFPESAISATIFPQDLAEYVTQYYMDQGVEIDSQTRVVGLRKSEDKVALQTNKGKVIDVDHVIAGIGILPNTELAEATGLEVENGIVVDAYLQTSQKDIFAAGDVANFYSPALDRRTRVEHEDNALQMGKTVGVNMAGGSIAYAHIPLFYSDLFDLGYEAVGRLNSTSQVIADWREPYREGSLYYLENDRVAGVLLWNIWGKADIARQLIGKESQAIKELLPEIQS